MSEQQRASRAIAWSVEKFTDFLDRKFEETIGSKELDIQALGKASEDFLSHRVNYLLLKEAGNGFSTRTIRGLERAMLYRAGGRLGMLMIEMGEAIPTMEPWLYEEPRENTLSRAAQYYVQKATLQENNSL